MPIQYTYGQLRSVQQCVLFIELCANLCSRKTQRDCSQTVTPKSPPCSRNAFLSQANPLNESNEFSRLFGAAVHIALHKNVFWSIDSNLSTMEKIKLKLKTQPNRILPAPIALSIPISALLSQDFGMSHTERKNKQSLVAEWSRAHRMSASIATTI